MTPRARPRYATLPGGLGIDQAGAHDSQRFVPRLVWRRNAAVKPRRLYVGGDSLRESRSPIYR